MEPPELEASLLDKKKKAFRPSMGVT